jgi:hypothetical protein
MLWISRIDPLIESVDFCDRGFSGDARDTFCHDDR